MKTRKNRKRADHSGSTFDGFLEEEGILEQIEAVAVKRVLAWLRTAKTDRTAAKRVHAALGAKHLYEGWIQS